MTEVRIKMCTIIVVTGVDNLASFIALFMFLIPTQM